MMHETENRDFVVRHRDETGAVQLREVRQSEALTAADSQET